MRFYTDITPVGRLGIAYIVAESNGTFASEPYIGYLQLNDNNSNTNDLLKSNWNPFEVNCNQVKTASSKVCVLVYNKINTDNNFVSADNVSKADFKILTPNSYNYYFTVENVVDNAFYKDIIINYGHYSLAAKPITSNLKTQYTLNYINLITPTALRNYYFEITYTGNSWVMSDTAYTSLYTGSSDTKSVSGQSILYNLRGDFYKYLWIKE